MQLSRAREAELREEVVSLRQEKQELQYNICLLEEDNHILREEIQNLRRKTLKCKAILFLHKLIQTFLFKLFYVF